jgi:spore maturation protein CgeB
MPQLRYLDGHFAAQAGDSRAPVEVVLTGGTPDWLNRNTLLRSHVAEGFEEALGPNSVHNVPLEIAHERARKTRPNLVLVFGSCLPDQCEYARLRAACDWAGCPLVFWFHDDPYEFDANAKVYRLADYIFSNDRWAAEHYHRDRVRHLLLAASPTAHAPAQPIVQVGAGVDVFFCGVAYPSRRRLIGDLSGVLAAVNAQIVGEGWDDSLPFCHNDRIDPSLLAGHYAAARVVLNMGRDFHYCNKKHQLDPSTPGPRTFEAAMAGACQIMFADSLEVLDYFKLDDEILLFDGPADFRKALDNLLANPEKCQNIGAAARARCLLEHTYCCRAKVILESVGISWQGDTTNYARAVA